MWFPFALSLWDHKSSPTHQPPRQLLSLVSHLPQHVSYFSGHVVPPLEPGGMNAIRSRCLPIGHLDDGSFPALIPGQFLCQSASGCFSCGASPPPQDSSLPEVISLNFPDVSPEPFQVCSLLLRHLEHVLLAEHLWAHLLKLPLSLPSLPRGLESPHLRSLDLYELLSSLALPSQRFLC